jgi:hypothetical protein
MASAQQLVQRGCRVFSVEHLLRPTRRACLDLGSFDRRRGENSDFYRPHLHQRRVVPIFK